MAVRLLVTSQVKYQTSCVAKLTVLRLTPGNYKSLVRSAKTLQKSSSHEEFQAARSGTWNKFDTEDPEMFGDTIKSLVSVVTMPPRILYIPVHANCCSVAFGAKVFPLVKAAISNCLFILSIFYLKTISRLYLLHSDEDRSRIIVNGKLK